MFFLTDWDTIWLESARILPQGMILVTSRENIISFLGQYMASQENVQFAYLFGSYAENKHKKDSDIDVAVYLSGVPEAELFRYKLNLKIELEDKLKTLVNVVVMNSAPPLLNHEVFKNGVIVKNSDPTVLSQFRARNFYYYLDQMYIINSYLEATKERIRVELNK